MVRGAVVPVILVSTVSALAALTVTRAAAERPPARKMKDGSTLRLLGLTYGKEHNLLADGADLGPDVDVLDGRRPTFTEDVNRLGIWLRRDGGEAGAPWAPWVVLADEHGCRFPARRWPQTLLPNSLPKVFNGQPVPPSAQVRHNFRHGRGSGTRGTGIPGPGDVLILTNSADLFPRRTPWIRVWVYDADGTRHEFEGANPHRPLPEDWTAQALPADVKQPGLSVTFESLTTGLDWDAIRRSKERGLPAHVLPPWHVKPAPDGEELLPWAQLQLKVAGAVSESWMPDGVKLEDRWGNSVVYRPLHVSERTMDGRMWLAFPASLCEREPAWKVTLLLEHAGGGAASGADIVWKHADVAAPQPEEKVPLAQEEVTLQGVTLRSRGLTGRGSKAGFQEIPLVHLTAVIPPGETVEPTLMVTDQNGRPVKSELFFQTTSLPERSYAFSLELRPEHKKLNLTFGIWKNRQLTALLKPQSATGDNRYSEAREAKRVGLEETALRHFWKLATAARRGVDRKALVVALVKEGLDLNQPFRKTDSTPLTLAVEGQDAELVQALLEAGADPNRVSYSNVPPLNTASRGTPAVVRNLLRAGADVNGTSGDVTALMGAAATARVEIVQLLLEAGADVNRRRARGDTALSMAMRRAGTPNGDAVIKLLKEAGARMP